MLKLWKISQDENSGYETYSDAVVCAPTEEVAKVIHPGGDAYWHKESDVSGWWVVDGFDQPNYRYDGWTHPNNVTAVEIGIAHPDVQDGEVICASFG